MKKKRINEESVGLLPINLRESRVLTTKQKIVLNQLILLNGLEKVKKDGYFFRSNSDLCKDCEIAENTLRSALKEIELLGFIKRKQGSRKDGASEYYVDEYRIGLPNSQLPQKNCSNNYSENCGNKIAEMELRIKKLEDSIAQLLQKNCSNNYSENCTHNYSNQEETQETPIRTPIPTTITNTKITQKTIEEHMEEIKLNGYEDLKKEVDNELVGTTENELKDSYYSTIDKMRKRQAVLGKNYTRIRLYIDRTFNDKIELIQTTVSTDEK